MQNPLVGEIRLFAFTFAPNGWAPCAGQLLPISQNTALYTIIGITFGGDGKTTFALPDYSGLAPRGLQYCIAIQGIYPQGGGGVAVAGELALLPYSFAPPGWMNSAGQILPVDEDQPLFAALGARFGGDGETTFGLPNLTATPPPAPAGDGGSLYFISLFGAVGAPTALLGTVQLLPFASVPAGWAACEGQLLPIVQHQGLFSLLGTTFGGDGHTTFGLPDLRALPVPAGVQYCICVSASMPFAATPGQAEEADASRPAEGAGSHPTEEGNA